jgi:hypothetical protein
MILSRHLPLAIIALLLSATPTLAAFSDVPSIHSNADAINYAQKEYIVSGYPDGTFKPDQLINRAEFTKIIMGGYNAVDEVPSECGRSDTMYLPFSDVHNGDWFAFRVCIAVQKGVVQGYPDGTFRPAANINFVEAAKMISVAIDPYDFTVPAYEYGTEWYERFVQYLAAENAIPLSIARFNQPITRGEMAEMIYRLKAQVTTKPSRTYEDFLEVSKPASSATSIEWKGWSENGYFFQIPDDWDNARDSNGRTIFVDGYGITRATLSCPIPIAGFEAWDFQQSRRTLSDRGLQYGATLWLGKVRDPADRLGDLNILFMHRNTFDHWYDDGGESYSCMLASGEGALKADVWEHMYESVEILSE